MPHASDLAAPDDIHRNGTAPQAPSTPTAIQPATAAAPAPTHFSVLAAAPDDDDETVDLRQYLAAFWRRRYLMLATLAALLGVGVIYNGLQTPIYQATATILVSTPGTSGGVQSSDLLPSLLGGAAQTRSLGQQMAIIQSPMVQKGALKRLPGPQQAEIQRFARTEIKPQADADAIQVAAQSYRPEAAALFANAICGEYIEQSQDQNRAQVKAATKYVQGQLETVRQRLDKAATDLKNYRQSQNTIDLDAESKGLIAQVNQIEGDARAAATERLASAAQIRELQNQVQKLAPDERTPTVIVRTPAVETLRAQLTRLQLDRIAKSREYLPSSRIIQDVDRQIADVQSQLKREAQTQVASWQPNPLRTGLNQDIARLQAVIWASESREKSLQSAALETRRALNQLPERAYRLGQLTTDQATLQQAYQTLNERYQTLRIQEEARVANARVLARAEIPGSPISPRKMFNLMMAGGLGLLLACALALVTDRLDDRVHADEDVTAATRLPILAHIPVIEANDLLLLNQSGQTSPLLESYRMLRTNIAFSGLDRPLRSVIVTSSQPSEGKSTSAANLATVMAASGKTVIIVDCDLRRPKMHTLFDVPNRVGFTNVVAGQATLEKALQMTLVPNLRVLTSGPIPPNPPELLDSRKGRGVLQQVMDEADFVVLDCPPALLLTDAQILGTIADAALLVVSCDEAGKREVARTCELISRAGARMLGVILNKVTDKRGGAYGYYGKNGKYGAYGGYFNPAPEDPTPSAEDADASPPDADVKRLVAAPGKGDKNG